MMLVQRQWTPYGGSSSMNRCMNGFLADSLRRNKALDSQSEQDNDCLATWYPATDIYDTKDGFVFKMELPGLKKEDVDVEIEDNILSIKGERKEEKEFKDDSVHRTERYSGKFYRAFRLPKNVDAKKIDASMKDGILELKVAKPEEIKPKQVPVSVN